MGTLDEALERLHGTGPERDGRLSNHAPMVAEALAAHDGTRVHPWVERYRHKLEDVPSRLAPITDDDWRNALGAHRRVMDWTDHFTRALAEHPWPDVLARWWPRLLPGMHGAATHPVIRTGHAVRALAAAETAPRRAELAHALGYWAASHRPLPRLRGGPAVSARAAGALAEVVPPRERPGTFAERLGRLRGLPSWADGVREPEEAADHLAELVGAALGHYVRHARGGPVLLVHAATAPNAVLRTLPHLPREQWAPSLHAAWGAASAVAAAYAPADRPGRQLEGAGKGVADKAPGPGPDTMAELLDLAVAHGDEHVIKLADTARDSDTPQGRAAVREALRLVPVLEDG